MNFSIEFNYPTELEVPEDQERIASGFTVESHTPLAKFTQTKITDPSSPFKTKYEVLYYKKQDHKSGSVYTVTGDEYCHLTIWSPY